MSRESLITRCIAPLKCASVSGARHTRDSTRASRLFTPAPSSPLPLVGILHCNIDRGAPNDRDQIRHTHVHVLTYLRTRARARPQRSRLDISLPLALDTLVLHQPPHNVQYCSQRCRQARRSRAYELSLQRFESGSADSIPRPSRPRVPPPTCRA
jgi:hypothetical protein